MASKYSFLILNSSGKFVWRTHCSNGRAFAIFGAAVFLAAIIALGAADYIRLSRKDLRQKQLKTEMAHQYQELVQHRRQIQTFAREINRLKHRMIEVDQMDQHIRRVAQMKENDGLFGIGGSAPSDLDPDIEPSRNHNRLMVEMHRQLEELDHAVQYQHKSLNGLWKIVQERGNLMAYTPTVRPAEGWVSSFFGYRQSPFTGRREFHYGLDIANSWNSDVCATADGYVVFAGEKGSYGNLILIDHGHGLKTLYAHLDAIFRTAGESIERGDIVGCMGNTGRSTGIHLHYEVRLNGVPVNPQNYILN